MACDVSDKREESREPSATEEPYVPATFVLTIVLCWFVLNLVLKIPWLTAPQIHEESSTTEYFCIWVSGNLMKKCQYIEDGPVLGTDVVKSLYKEISNVGN